MRTTIQARPRIFATPEFSAIRTFLWLLAAVAGLHAQAFGAENVAARPIAPAPPEAPAKSTETASFAAPAPELDSMFAPREGWAGGDGAYSMELKNGRRVWLFSDTWISKIDGTRRVQSRMINNSAGIFGSGGEMSFHYRTEPDGKPGAILKPGMGSGFFWLFAGVAEPPAAWIFLQRVRLTDDRSAFGFEVLGTELARISNIDDAPTDWRFTVREAPFSGRRPGSHRIFGCAAAQWEDDVLVFGVEMAVTNRPFAMVAAKAPAGQLGDFSKWRFFNGRRWSASPESMRPILESIPTEFSVHRADDLPGRPWILTYMEGGIFGNILMRVSESPTGPWSEPVRIYDCPEKTYGAGVFCYSAKAHPGFMSQPGQVVVSYCPNAPSISTVLNDTSLYRPRFVRVNLEQVVKRAGASQEDSNLGKQAPRAINRAALRWLGR